MLWFWSTIKKQDFKKIEQLLGQLFNGSSNIIICSKKKCNQGLIQFDLNLKMLLFMG